MPERLSEEALDLLQTFHVVIMTDERQSSLNFKETFAELNEAEAARAKRARQREEAKKDAASNGFFYFASISSMISMVSQRSRVSPIISKAWTAAAKRGSPSMASFFMERRCVSKLGTRSARSAR